MRLLLRHVAPVIPALVLLAAGPAPAEPGFQPGAGTVRAAGPFTETWAQMVANHAQWQRDVASGKVPAPPETIVARDHDDEFDKSGPELAYDQLPAAFKDRNAPVRPQGAPPPRAPQPVTVSFLGLSKLDTAALGLAWIPPDTNGAIGPNHFVELVNGAIAIYDRSGTRLSAVTDQSFFRITVGATTYPRNGSYDPRIIYDRRSGRWIACELEFGPSYNAAGDTHENHMMLAVSQTSDPTGAWNKYVMYSGLPDASSVRYFSDFETLGTDNNGVYWAVRYFPTSGNSFVRLWATRKTPLLTGVANIDTYYMADTMAVHGTPHPALNQDNVGPSGTAWFAAASSLSYSNLWLRSLTWPATGGPTWGDQQLMTTPAFGETPGAPSSGSASNIDTGGVRLQNAVIMNNKLWAARNVGTNSVGGSASVDRCGVEYLVVDVSGVPATFVQSGRKYDTAASSPIHYFYPSICPTGTGSAAMGFSDSNGSRYVAAATCGRLAGDTAGTLQSVTTLQDGLNSYRVLDSINRNRWGDYSYTSLDPRNNQAIWTVQEYALGTANVWGTYIAKLGGIPPFIISANGLLLRGILGTKLSIVGSDFYDPGQDFPDRFGVSIYGRVQVDGTTVQSVNLVDSGHVAVVVDVDPKATLGLRTITITNPDGQSDSATVLVKTTTKLTLAANGGQRGQTITASASLIEGDTGAGASGQTVAVYLDGVLMGTGVTDATGLAKVPFKIPETATTSSVFRAVFADTVGYVGSTSTARWAVKSNTTSLYVAAPVPTAAGAYIKMYAYLKRTIDGKLLAGQPVTFNFAGVVAGSTNTDANGYCEVLYLIPTATAIGANNIGATFAGDATNLSCSGSGSATVNPGTPTAVYLNTLTGGWGTTVSLYTYLYQVSPKVMLPNQKVEFLVDGVAIGTATTDVNGYAKVPYKIPANLSVGAHSTMVRYLGDGTYGASSRTSTLTVSGKYGSLLSVLKATGVNKLPVTLKAYLYRALDGAALPERTVTFTVDRVAVGTAVTNGLGLAQFVYTVPAGTTAGVHALGATFAGDAGFDATSGASTLTTALLDTLSIVAPAQTATRGLYVTLYFYAKSSTTGLLVAGRKFTLSLDGTAVATVTTDANGYAAVRYLVPLAAPVGAHTVQIGFAGDTVYNAGSWTTTLTVK